jgi:multidrug efflux pump subunit AcrA (membrane-fusion protein)
MTIEKELQQMLEQNEPLEERPFRLESLEMVKTGKGPKIIGALLLIMFFVLSVLVMFVPWRQSVVGSGEIIVFAPMQRPQTIEALIPGRLLGWYVRDGELVRAGQLIADLSDLDPRYLDRNQLKRLVDQRQSLMAKREAAKERLNSLKNQLANLGSSREAAMPAAEQRVGQASDRLYAAQQSVEVAEQNVKTSQWQVDRVSSLYDKGLRSQRDQQVAQLDNIKAKTELQRAKSAYDVVKRDVDISSLDYKRVSADTQGSINAIKASMSEANQVIATASADIDGLEIGVQNMAERIQQRAVRAPCAGRVVRLNRVGAGETVAAGAVLATIVPGTEDRAAAIMIRDYDAPLVAVGNPVRLAISGWPALQFMGWPSIAVGTFAGRIAVVDAVDDGKHFYRIIVVPDQEAIGKKKEEPWPSVKYLRPGAQATGWVLLSNVPLWYELWRQFNGFQPTVPAPTTDNASGETPNGESGSR